MKRFNIIYAYRESFRFIALVACVAIVIFMFYGCRTMEGPGAAAGAGTYPLDTEITGDETVLATQVDATKAGGFAIVRIAGSDLPISDAAQAALDLKQDASTAATDIELADGLATKMNSNPGGTTSQVVLGNGTLGALPSGSTITADGTDPTKAAVAVLADTASAVPGSGITGNVPESVIDADITRDSELASGLSGKQDTITSSTDITAKDITADSVTTNFVDGSTGIFWPNDNTTTPTLTGRKGIWPESDGVHFSNDGTDGGIIGSSSGGVTIDDTATGEGHTDVALSATEIDSRIATAITEAMNNLGYNMFYFTPNTTFPLYVSASPASVSFEITDANTNYDIASVLWQYDGGGYGTNTMTNTTGDTWTADVTISSEGSAYLQLQATDDKSNDPNSGESAGDAYAIILDETLPVGVADADGTHSGTGDRITSGIDWTETYLDASSVTCTVVNATPTNPTITTVGNASDTEALTPDGTGTVTCTWNADDLAGNSATGTDLVQEFTYSGGSAYSTIFSAGWDCSDTTDAATCDGWTSETDTTGIGAIASTTYVVSRPAGVTSDARVTKSTGISGESDYEIAFDVSLSEVAYVTSAPAEQTALILSVYNSAGVFLSVGVYTNTTGAIIGVKTIHYDDSGSATTVRTPLSISAATAYTLTIRADIGEGSTSDGVLYVDFGGTNLINITDSAVETRAVISEVRLGFLYADWTEANTITFDNFSVGTK
jgi:hypothetical protein